MAKKVTNGFRATVLTHLEYIKKKQEEHDRRFDKLNSEIKCKMDECEIRFTDVEKKQSKFQSWVWFGVTIGGLVGSIIGFVLGIIVR